MRAWQLVLGAAVALAAASCSETECAPGTALKGGACVAACGPGTESEPGTGRCVATCEAGTFRDPSSGACVPEAIRCGSDGLWDEAARDCVDSARFCAPRSTYVSSEARCVPDAELRTPAQFEGDGYNDHGSIPPTCEALALPAPGAAPISFGGRIDRPVDGAGIGLGPVQYADRDCWAFDVEGPTLLRFFVDGRGGAAPGLLVVPLEGAKFSERRSLGRTDRAIHREIFLPMAGRYAAVVTDAFNLVSEQGVYRGGGALGYYAEVEVRPLPEPIPLRLENGRATARGVFSPIGPLDASSSIRLFSLAGGPEQLFEATLRIEGTGLSAMITGTAGNGRPLDAGVSRAWTWPLAFDRAGTAVFAVDHDRSIVFDPVPWELAIEERPLTILDGDQGEVSIEQPAWTRDEPLPWRYVGFRASVGEVAALHVDSSTGFTCAEVWTEAFDFLEGDAQCWYGGVPFEELELRFHPTYDGLYLLRLYDWTDAFFDGNSPLSFPALDYQASVTLYHERPVELGGLAEPWESRETVTEERWERYFALDPEAGDAFWFEIDGIGAFEPVFVSWWIAPDRWVHSMYPMWYTFAARFAHRSATGDPMLIGISDIAGSAGSFDFRARRIEPLDGGRVVAGAPVESSHLLEAGTERQFLRLDVPEPGLFDLTLRSSAADLWLVPLAPDFVQVPDLALRTDGPQGTIRFRRPLAGPAFFELLPVDGETLAAATTVTLEASVSGYAREEEDNDSPANAQVLTLPTTLAAEGSSGNEVDWDFYVFDVTSPTTVDIVASSLVVGGQTWPHFVLFGTSGPCEGFDCRRTVANEEAMGLYALRGFALSEPGRYTIRVDSTGRDAPYLLEVRHAEP